MGWSRHSYRRSRRRRACWREFPRPPGRVLFAAAEGASRTAIDGLGADHIPLYRTRLLEPEPPDGDVVVLASGSAARAYAGIGGRAPAVSIGAATSQAARACGLTVVGEAGSHDLEGLVERGCRSDELRSAMTVITFLTDFGLEDDFVGTCHGVIARIAPEARVIDITHGIGAQAVLTGGLVLRSTIAYMPVGVHLAVVDPDVGGNRRAVAVATADGRTFVGPDNGLLMLAADELGLTAAHEITDERYLLRTCRRRFTRATSSPRPPPTSRPASRSASSAPPSIPETLVRLEVPEPAVGRNQISTTVLVVDRFGNVATNTRSEHLEALGSRTASASRSG